jgi:hypothetical protein
VNTNIDALNKKYFGFLEDEYGFSYNNNIFSTSQIEISIEVSGFTARVLSEVQLFIWHKAEPECTKISYTWIAEHLDLHPELEVTFDALLDNYQKLSTSFREHAQEVLYQNKDWLLPSMKLQFEWLTRNFTKLENLIQDKSMAERYNYIKLSEPNWNP